jgi:hypothetical protein
VRIARAFSAVVAVIASAVDTAHAQSPPTPRDSAGLQLRQLSVGSGFMSMQLPPITLGGYLPTDVSEGMVSNGEGELGWNLTHRDSAFALAAAGSYTRRVKYSNASDFGGSLSVGGSHTFGRRLQLHGIANGALNNADQVSFQTTETEDLVNAESTFDGLARAIAYPKSRNPNPAQAAWFVPIRQSQLLSAQAYGNRTLSRSASGGISYSPSSRGSVFVDAIFSVSSPVGSSHEPNVANGFSRSEGRAVTAGASYSTSPHSALTASGTYARSFGLFENESGSATFGYGWTGRRWFMNLGSGLSYRPPQTATTIEADREGVSSSTDGYDIVYAAHVGFKTATQTLVAGAGQAPNDSQGLGSLRGSLVTASASWYWNPARRSWGTRVNFDLRRVPGNFLHINSFYGHAAVIRELNPSLRASAEMFFDRHGSKSFEGFHLTREGVTFNLTWTPQKRLL